MTSVCSKDDNGCQIAFKGSIEVCEALDIEHMDLIDEEDTWDQLCNTVIDVLVHYFVDLKSKLLSDLGLLWSVDLAH